MKLSGNDKHKERAGNKERINFRGSNLYFSVPLVEIESVTPEIIKGKTVLVGLLRDSLITPMNDRYDHPGEIEGDMSEVEISANIISTMNRGEFINDVNRLFRILIIVTVSLTCTALVRLVCRGNNVLNILLALLIFIALNGISSYLIVFAFSKNYYLELNEMTLVLIISVIVSVYWNTRDRRGSASPIESY